MKRNSILFAGICAMALVFAGIAAAQAAKVGGSWDMSMEGPQGTISQTLTIQQTGNKIAGTLKGARGEAPLDGTLDGKTITFSVKRTTPNGDVTQVYTGTVSGDSISGTVKMGQNDRPWTAKLTKN